MALRPRDFKSLVSTDSTTQAKRKPVEAGRPMLTGKAATPVSAADAKAANSQTLRDNACAPFEYAVNPQDASG